MTALVYYFEPNAVFVAMDTLALSEDHKPAIFTSKIFPVLHLNGIICGTGLGPFVVDWFKRVNSGMLALDIPHLDEFTPGQLRAARKDYVIDDENTVTIYHFGFSESEQKFRGFAYRSKSDFNSEELPYNSVAIKPFVELDLSERPLNLPEDFIDIVSRQRDADNALPINKRLGVGGEIHFIYMTPGNICINRAYRFSDHSDLYNQMCSKLM